MGNRRNLADSTEVATSIKNTEENFTPLTRASTSRVTTSRPSYSFARADPTKRVDSNKRNPPSSTPNTSSRPRSSSPVKNTAAVQKTAIQEISSQSHQKAHVDAITKSSQFRSKTSLTPRSVELFNNTPTSPIHALNFSASPQATTSSTNIHATGEFQPSTVTSNIPPASSRYSIETIMEADKESDAGYQLGMEGGFENSPMAKLMRQYAPEDLESQNLSTQTKVQLIIDVEDLGPEMIIDRGLERSSGSPRYHLAPKDLDRVQSTVTELQLFLQQAARLIEERQTHFIIDPGDTLLPILSGTSSLGQMNAAWKALRLCIELGTKAWRKYLAEYRQTPEDNLILSPLSTLPELYTELDGMDDGDQKLRFLYSKVPHHRDQLTDDGRTSLEKARSSWFHVLKMPAGLREAFRTDDKPTPMPTPHEQPQELPTTTNKGKERERQDVQPSSSARRGMRDMNSPKAYSAQARPDSTIWLGQDTPFKSANSWFVEPGKSNRSRQEGTSSNQTLTQDILVGIATPQSALPSAGPAEWKGRETPPHLPSRGRKAWSGRGRDILPQSRRVSPQEVRNLPSMPQRTQCQNGGESPDDSSDDDPPPSCRSGGRHG